MNKCYHHNRVLRRHKGQSHRFVGTISSPEGMKTAQGVRLKAKIVSCIDICITRLAKGDSVAPEHSIHSSKSTESFR